MLNSLRAWGWALLALAALTLWLLPLPTSSKAWIAAVVVFAGVFTLLDEANRRAKLLAAAMVALLVLYMVLTLHRAVLLLGIGQWVTTLIGIALLVLPVVGVWAMLREVLFGARVEKLAATLAEEGGLPEDDLPRTPAGRIDRAAADAQFPQWRDEVVENPEDWRTWFRLSLAYDAAGDRTRARRSMRDAVAVSRGRQPRALVAGED